MSRKIYIIVEEEFTTGEVKRLTAMVNYREIHSAAVPILLFFDRITLMARDMGWTMPKTWRDPR